jgi:hypothetical protein
MAEGPPPGPAKIHLAFRIVGKMTMKRRKHTLWLTAVVAVSCILCIGCQSKREVCANNLMLIAASIESTVLELDLYEGDPIPIDHIVLFMKHTKLPVCDPAERIPT